MFTKVVDYVHVERGIIPRDVCERTLSTIAQADWRAHQWHNPVKNESFGEQNEPDMLFPTNEVNAVLTPHILSALQAYGRKFAPAISDRTASIFTRFSYVRFNRYRAGQGMAMHFDHIHSLFEGDQRGIPVISIVGNLNEGYEGGDLVFFNGDHAVSMATGDICMFPSCFVYPHEAQRVTMGERISFAAWAW